MPPPENPDSLSPAELKALVVELLGRVRDLERQVAARDAEIARLKGLKSRPDIKPSGMEQRWLGFPRQRFGSAKWIACRLMGTSSPMLWRYAGRA